MKNDFPEIYGKLEITENKSVWTAARTKPRHEKKVARKCLDYNFPYYLPQKDSVRQYKNRIKTYKIPLFPGYIFCKLSPADQRKLYGIGSILTYLIPNHQDLLVKELVDLYKFHNLGADFTKHKFITRGKTIRIIRGPFKGYEGKVSHRNGNFKVVLNVSLINQAVSVEVDAQDVAIIE